MKLYLVGVEVSVRGRPDIELVNPRLSVNILAHSEDEARWRGEQHVAAAIGKSVPYPQLYTYVAFHVSEIVDKDARPHMLWQDDDPLSS